jgi:hypothetical protein
VSRRLCRAGPTRPHLRFAPIADACFIEHPQVVEVGDPAAAVPDIQIILEVARLGMAMGWFDFYQRPNTAD